MEVKYGAPWREKTERHRGKRRSAIEPCPTVCMYYFRPTKVNTPKFARSWARTSTFRVEDRHFTIQASPPLWRKLKSLDLPIGRSCFPSKKMLLASLLLITTGSVVILTRYNSGSSTPWSLPSMPSLPSLPHMPYMPYNVSAKSLLQGDGFQNPARDAARSHGIQNNLTLGKIGAAQDKTQTDKGETSSDKVAQQRVQDAIQTANVATPPDKKGAVSSEVHPEPQPKDVTGNAKVLPNYCVVGGYFSVQVSQQDSHASPWDFVDHRLDMFTEPYCLLDLCYIRRSIALDDGDSSALLVKSSNENPR
ncbi:hypothetical protein EGW08_023193 [Elysia chlorotica]|uniref:Uncharacterized protein n=1 Tax=Elysia chlorotica TaxID=188477 RepID=A0A3S0Z215_ELYCH|nr:hypothetical protein EGW08_023193 [Elysia chlorotica]